MPTNVIDQIRLYLSITHTHGILRRYFVVNGFDGALTMLGLIMGFIVSNSDDYAVIVNACLGAAIALGVSGISSAYVSEQAELRNAINKLEDAMKTDLQTGIHGKALRWVPRLIALVNGSSPLLISMLIILPVWFANHGSMLIAPPLIFSVIIAFSLIFFLGIFLGRVSGISWLLSGLKTLLIAAATVLLIFILTGN